MAGRVMRAASILLAVVSIVVASTSVAQALRDPTRPPAAAGKGSAGKVEHSGFILQSVLISPERRYAIINDEVVPVGGSVAGAELIAIAEERVTLRTREGLRVLHLFPEVTRLGAPYASQDTTARMHSPDAQKDTAARKSGDTGIKK